MSDEALPEDAGALILAGGFPEVFVGELAANASLRGGDRARSRARGGRSGRVRRACSTWPPSSTGRPMCGVLPVRATMTRRLTLGYREATAITATPWLEAGEQVRGHEFHYAQVEHLEAPATWGQTPPGGV